MALTFDFLKDTAPKLPTLTQEPTDGEEWCRLAIQINKAGVGGQLVAYSDDGKYQCTTSFMLMEPGEYIHYFPKHTMVTVNLRSDEKVCSFMVLIAGADITWDADKNTCV